MAMNPKTEGQLGWDAAVEDLASTFTQAQATRMAEQTAERAAGQFLNTLNQELSAERQMELLLRALAASLRAYAVHGKVEIPEGSMLDEWWSRDSFRELGQALRLFRESAEEMGAQQAQHQFEQELPKLVERRAAPLGATGQDGGAVG